MNKKICILGDTHIGARNGSKGFSQHFNKFFDQILFPYLKQNEITTIVQLGDILDNRKNINVQAITEGKDYFFDKIEQHGLKMITLIGNHDIFYKNSLKINSPSLLLNSNNIEIIDSPREMELFGNKVLMLPWICEENKEESFDLIANTDSDICFGHLEFSGFAMYRGIIAEEGMNSNTFGNFEFVFSGHYHCKSTRDNIYYVGTPYQLTWNDYGDPKGFHIFDFENRMLQFIPNIFNMYHKIFYDDTNEEDIRTLMKSDFSMYENTYIKIIIKSKENPYLFDLFLEELNKVDPIDISIIEESIEVLSEEIKDIDETQDTLTTLNQFVDSIKSKDFDANRLKNVLGSLYHEAMSIQT